MTKQEETPFNSQSNMTIGERDVIDALLGLNSGAFSSVKIEGVHQGKKQKLGPLKESEIGWELPPHDELPPSLSGSFHSFHSRPPPSNVGSSQAPFKSMLPPKKQKRYEEPIMETPRPIERSNPPPPPPPVVHETLPRKPTRAITANWQHHYEELKEFKKINRHCNVSRKNMTWKSLGHWVRQQRRKKKQDQLNQTQINLLDNLGFEWDRSYYLYTKAPYRDAHVSHDDDESYE